VLNEGNFNYSNASVDYIDFSSDTVYRSVFFAKNGFMLGDVLQSAFNDTEIIMFVVNNSGKIVIADKKTLSYKKAIGGLTSPRYIAKYADKYFVTDLYSPFVSIIDQSAL
jgi:hypothetical protein